MTTKRPRDRSRATILRREREFPQTRLSSSSWRQNESIAALEDAGRLRERERQSARLVDDRLALRVDCDLDFDAVLRLDAVLRRLIDGEPQRTVVVVQILRLVIEGASELDLSLESLAIHSRRLRIAARPLRRPAW